MQNYPHQPYGQQPQQQYPNYQQPQGWGQGAQPQAVEGGAERLAFVRKVYALFTGSVVLSAVGAMLALNLGAGSSEIVVQGTPVPPLVALVAGSPLIAMIAMFGLVFGASAVRKVRGLNVVALFGMAFLLGVIFAPSLFVAQLYAGLGATLSENPVRDAFLLSVAMFGGLTAYVAISKKDFSYLGGALSMGFFIILGGILLNLFIGSSVLSLALASVGLILFGGYVLYDTSRILRSQERSAIGGALTLYLDFINIFLFLLRILGSRR